MATANPNHQPIVPMAGGIPPRCTCGWKSARFPKVGEYLADHLRSYDPTYGQPSREIIWPTAKASR